MSENILVVRAKGYLNKEAFKGMHELIKDQVDVPFIIIDESVEDLDVLYGLNDKGEPLLNIDGTIAQYHPGTGVDLSGSIETIHVPVDGKWREGHAVHGPSVDIEFLKKQHGDKWREGIPNFGIININADNYLPKGTNVFNTDDTLDAVSYIQQSYEDKP